MKARRVVSKEGVTTVVDRGAEGPAMMVRPSKIEVIEGDVVAEDGTTSFERTTVLRIADSMLDQYHRSGILVGRRYEAAVKLATAYSQARSPSRVAGSYGSRLGGFGEMTDEQDEAWSEYCRLLDHIPKGCQPACMAIARDMFPTGLSSKRHLEDGFKELADHLKIPSDDAPRAPSLRRPR